MDNLALDVAVLIVLPLVVFATELLPPTSWLARAIDGLVMQKNNETGHVAEDDHVP
jgi:hypothetical protein